MSSKHLTIGSTKPNKVEGKLRLYSMEYCPYAQRARLVLLAKGIPHDIVNVNLTKKPDWYFEVHPEGKVPALDNGKQIIVESLDIADFLDEQYPEPALYPSDLKAREHDKALIQKIGPLTGAFYKLISSQEKEKFTAADWLKELAPHLDIFEEELRKRNSTFFGGDKAGMVDYMLWPWGERAGITAIMLGEKLPLRDDQYQHLRAWRKAMRTQPAVDTIYHGANAFHKLMMHKLAGTEPDYDNV